MAGKQAFEPEVWVDRHGDALYKYAMMRLRDPALAEEAVQETLLAALQAFEKFSGQSSERTWLVGILKHKIVDYFRRTSRERPATEDESMPQHVNDLFDENDYWHHDLGPIDWNDNPATVFQQTEFRLILDHCLGELPTRTASVFTLREMEELESEEICKVLGISTTNLWVLLHRARSHLRHCLEMKWFGKVTKTSTR